MIHRVINDMILYFENDSRRINHSLKVYGFAAAISGMEGVAEKESTIISLAALLHDIGIKEAERKYNSSAGRYQEIEGPPIAGQILKNLGIDNGIIERVCYIVGNHHSYGKIDGLDFQIIVEADFLVNIFEEQMAREAIESIRRKYFKTENGVKLLDMMYLM